VLISASGSSQCGHAPEVAEPPTVPANGDRLAWPDFVCPTRKSLSVQPHLGTGGNFGPWSETLRSPISPNGPHSSAPSATSLSAPTRSSSSPWRTGTPSSGTYLGATTERFFANGPVAWIQELMVGESSRHQGVATKLVSAAEEWASTVPAAYIGLASRRAGDFYLRTGYEESATYFRKTIIPPQR
jgi:hypothetical protein